MAAAVLALPALAVAQTQVARDIHVDLSHVDPSLSCATVGERTQVRFDAKAVAFRPARVTVLLNGMPVANDRVRYAWPEVTLDGGLLAGRNTVELVAQRADGSSVERSIIIKVGDSVRSSDGITLGCSGVENQPTTVVQAPVVQQTQGVVAYGAPQTVVYAAPPVYYGGWYGNPWYGDPWYGSPWYGGYYGWAPSLSIGLGYGWGGGWGGGHRHWGGGGWRGGGHWRHR